MTGPLALLRGQRGRPRPSRRRATIACALLALAAPAAGSADSLQPDPATAPASTGLQPDAFGGSAASATHVEPVRSTEGLSPLGKTVTKPAVTQPSTRAGTPAATPAPIHLPPVTHPVVVPAAPVASLPVATKPLAIQPQAKAHPTRPIVKHRARPRLRLPVSVRGSFSLPMPTVTARPTPTTTSTPTPRRDLVPAALGLLALVLTSGCLLAVAARFRREELGA
jgi:hypothetical protein